MQVVNETDYYGGGTWKWQVGNLVEAGPVKDGQLLELRTELVATLQSVSLHSNNEDGFLWKVNADRIFTINSCYDRFKHKLFDPPLPNTLRLAINHL